MAVVGTGRQVNPLRLRIVRSRGPIALTTVVATAVVGFVGYGMAQLWSIHATDVDLRPTLETGIAAAATVGVILLVARFRQTHLLRDLALLSALGAVALTDCIFHVLPAYGWWTGGYGAGAGVAMTIVAAGAFVAVAFAPCGESARSASRRSQRSGGPLSENCSSSQPAPWSAAGGWAATPGSRQRQR
jgi:hypothetical protein